ncbi:ABC transporter substrate-binding protein [Martelella soudanensis]|uniref:ABC transporter substrate-binding protein n=1 Tax=unclassified Martelella TaxID=2629616 RepID=UPI001FEEAA29|nr:MULTISPECIES: ABC transporter substrate-binding protein [unclassified Martelella]
MAATVAALVGLSPVTAGAQTAGGDLVVVQSSNPPSLDAMVTSSQASRNVTMNIYEPLFGFSENIQPIPILAESVDISPDGKTYHIPLRQGVKFHNGKEMTAEDVKASLERYIKYGATQAMLEPVDKIDVAGPYEVTLTLKAPSPTFLEAFASPRAPAVIIPAEEAVKGPNEIEIIGTGPYKFVEYVPDSHVKLERFEDYSANEAYDGIDGFGGRKTAYLDTVTFRVIPEPGAAVAALETGEVQLLEQLPVPTARRLAANGDIEIYENMPWAFLTLIFNMKEAPGDNPKFREAVQVALNDEEIMAIATEGLFQLYHGWMYEGSTYDAGDIGKDRYNVADAERAKALLKEAGYNNEPFSILTDSTIPEHGKAAVVIAEQLKAVGINAVINQVDWPTALKIRLQDEGWNAWTLMMGIEPYLGPAALISTLTGQAPHFRANDEQLDALYQELISTDSVEGRKEVFAEIQERLYEFGGIIKLGETGLMQASTADVKGFKPFRFPRVYDVWIESN